MDEQLEALLSLIHRDRSVTLEGQKLLVDEIERLQGYCNRLGIEFPDQPYQGAFGMHIKRDETLLEAMSRWYQEFDKVRSDDRAKIKQLQITVDDFMSYFDPRGGVSDVPRGPFDRAREAAEAKVE